MAQFTLVWNNTAIINNPNIIGQLVGFRYKGDTGFIEDDFTPPNGLSKLINTVDSPQFIDENRVVEFKVQSICTVSGPTDNDNGLQEAIQFGCITPTMTNNSVRSIITLDITGLNITKARFTLRKTSDNSLIIQTTVNPVGNIITTTRVGLTPETNYYWQIELYANINNIEVKSSDSTYLGAPCSPYAFATDPDPICDPVTSLVTTSIEIP